MKKQENITVNKDTLIERIKEKNTEEKRLIGKIISQVRLARKKSRIHVNVDEKQLRVHLTEVIKLWEKTKATKIINKFLEEIKESLEKKENIFLHGYFSLKIHRSKRKSGMNPLTGKIIKLQEKNRISFRAGSQLKQAIN